MKIVPIVIGINNLYYEHFLACPDPSGKVYQANYKIDKIEFWGAFPGY